jgi:nucleoside-diphosphate-sugar epimerase
MKIMFIGGPGNISTSTARKVLNNGDQLAIFTLPGTDEVDLAGKVRFYEGDRNNSATLQSALSDFNPEIVVDFCCFFPHQAEQLYSIIKGKLRQFVFVSSVDVYGYPLSRLPMRESDPWNPTNCSYAENKRLVEVFYQNKYDKERFPLTIVRPAYSMGNNFVLTCLSRSGGRHLIPWLRAGKPVLSPGDGTTLIHASAAINTGRMIAAIIGTDFTIGESYTCGHETFITGDDYINLFALALHVKSNIVHVPAELILRHVDPSLEGFILPVLTAFNCAFSVEKFAVSFPGFRWDFSLGQAAREFIEHNHGSGYFADPGETILEDFIIQNYEKLASGFSLPDSGFIFYG